ncbi:MAG: hypothetical protein IPM96_14885 [Ignavibacteria bacterium]|nr:hypothetical protein [Ignavibacteria bacterium]
MKKIILILFLYLFSIQNSEAQWFSQESGTGNHLLSNLLTKIQDGLAEKTVT